MTQLFMDERPARSRRWPIYVLIAGMLVLALAVAAALRIYGPARNKPTPPSEAVATAQPEAASLDVPPTQTASQNPDDQTPNLAASGETARALLAEAKQLQAEEKWQSAREKGLAALGAAQTDATRSEAEAIVGAAGMELLLTPRPMPEKTVYTVQPGDSLGKIANQFGTTIELILKSNKLRSTVIQPDQRLRVFSGTWVVRVNKTRNDLVLTLNDTFFKRYRVGTGEYANTPVGEFKIVDRIPQPTWWHPDGRTIPFGDPENLLGTHWLALNIKGYGIHGTWEPDTIGKQSSMGCVRLVNSDIEELFTILPVGTPVLIEE